MPREPIIHEMKPIYTSQNTSHRITLLYIWNLMLTYLRNLMELSTSQSLSATDVVLDMRMILTIILYDECLY